MLILFYIGTKIQRGMRVPTFKPSTASRGAAVNILRQAKLNQMLHRSVRLCTFSLQLFSSAWIGVTVEHNRLDIAPNAFKTRESVINSRGFIPAVHHAISALGVAAFVAVIGPISFIDQFLKCVGVAFLQ